MNCVRLNVPVRVLLLLIVFTVSYSCNVMRQANEMKTFAVCDFQIESADKFELAGVNMDGVSRADDLGFTEITSIMLAFARGKLPLEFVLNIKIQNPNPSIAAMNKLEWILFIDDIEMTNGLLNKRVEISANGGTTVLPVDISFNLNNALDGKTADALINFVMNLNKQSERPTRIMLKAKPSIKVGGKLLNYPGYIKVESEI